jgi:hypothetical protein
MLYKYTIIIDNCVNAKLLVCFYALFINRYFEGNDCEIRNRRSFARQVERVFGRFNLQFNVYFHFISKSQRSPPLPYLPKANKILIFFIV